MGLLGESLSLLNKVGWRFGKVGWVCILWRCWFDCEHRNCVFSVEFASFVAVWWVVVVGFFQGLFDGCLYYQGQKKGGEKENQRNQRNEENQERKKGRIRIFFLSHSLSFFPPSLPFFPSQTFAGDLIAEKLDTREWKLALFSSLLFCLCLFVFSTESKLTGYFPLPPSLTHPLPLTHSPHSPPHSTNRSSNRHFNDIWEGLVVFVCCAACL